MFNFKRIHLPLQAKLWISIFAIVLSVLVLMTGVSYISISNTVHKKTESALNREIGLIQHNLETLTSTLDDFSVTFSVNRELQDVLKENNTAPTNATLSYNVNYKLSRIFANLTGSSSEFSSIEVLYSDNSLAKIGRYTVQSMTDNLDLEAIAETKETRHPVWCGPIKLTSSMGIEEECYAIYKSIYNLDSPEYLGCIVLHIPVERVNYIFEIASSENAYFYLLQNGQIISNKNVPDTIEDASLLALSSHTEQKTTEWLLMKQPFNMNNWQILGAIPNRYMTTEIRLLSISMIVISVISIFVVLLVAIILSHSIMRPVRELMVSVEQLPLEESIQHWLPEDIETTDRFTSQDLDLMVSKIHKLIEQIHLSQKLRNTLQFQVMQAQIKPHFLYNALETAASLVSLNMNEEATRYIRSLSTFYRLSLSSGDDIIPLDDEIRLTECYLEIQKHRYYEYFDFSVSVERPYSDYLVPKLLLQPLVENAIYHGCKGKSTLCHISLSVTERENNLILTIMDDGMGMDQATVSRLLQFKKATGKVQSYGLSNVYERLKLVYGDEAKLSIESEQGKGTKIELILPGGDSV